MGDVEIIDLSSDDDSDKETVSRPTIVQVCNYYNGPQLLLLVHDGFL